MGFQRRSFNLLGKLIVLPFTLVALLPAAVLFYLHYTELGKPLTIVETIQQDGKLLVATRNTSTTYYEGPNGPTGLEYDLVSSFAKSLGVEVEFVIFSQDSELLDAVENGEVHLAASGMTHNGSQRRLRFGPVYQYISRQLVYRRGALKPETLDDLDDDELEIAEGSHHEALLQKLTDEDELYVSWKNTPELDEEQLLYLLQEKVVKYTIANSNVVDFNKRFYPNLRVAFDIGQPEPLQWAMPKRKDPSLQEKVTRFFRKVRNNDMLETAMRRYYEHVDILSFADTHTFWQHVASRLPIYENLFKRVAKKNNYDWRLLAAVGYQESHWNPDAVSPTGVKGLMMLTNAAAKQVDIKDRTDPVQSVVGSARYLKILNKMLPDDIEMPDRQWFILAGYNVGFGHLEDARVLTQRQGADPDNWFDVRDRLPLLAQSKYHSTLKHGYARGREPVTYVDNIRNFYELLVWHTSFKTATIDLSEEPVDGEAEEKQL